MLEIKNGIAYHRAVIAAQKLPDKKGTQQEIADLIGINRPQVSILEKGELLPTKEQLDALCAYFGCTAGHLYKDDVLKIIASGGQ